MTATIPTFTDRFALIEKGTWPYLRLNMQTGGWTAGTHHESHNGWDVREHNRFDIEFKIYRPDAVGLGEWLASDEISSLVERIVAGFSARWNGNNHVGTLTEDAEAALNNLEVKIATAEYPQLREFEGQWDASDWFQNASSSELGIKADMTAEQVESLADELIAQGRDEGAILDRDDVLRELTARLDQLG